LVAIASVDRATPLAGVVPPDGWEAPAWLDLRPYCLPSDNQGNEPWCAAYAMACLIEVARWRKTHIPTQVDPAPIYHTAKTLDGLPHEEGTTLEAVVEASARLGLIAKPKIRLCKTEQDLFFALHETGVVLWGFNVDDGWATPTPQGAWVRSRGALRGGHAVAVCWYQREGPENGIGFQNSWGADWGLNGFGRMSLYDFERSSLGGLAVIFE